MKHLSIWLLWQLIVFAAYGQYSLRGTVTGNGEPLAGASVVILNTFQGTSSGSNGSFEFVNLRKGDYQLKISFIGYESKKLSVSIPEKRDITVDLEQASVMTDEVVVTATRAKDKTPVAYTNISGDEIALRNLGQDIPYLLQLTPSFVATSDAGAGIGYTNFRVRGTDMNRINITVNGIPLNDAESHGTWFVDQPDLASSLENLQIQRGVGTSTNGAAAFGATINLQTHTLKKDPYAEYKTTAGTFSTLKNTLIAGTGLLNGKFTIDARLSMISSEGYIDRAFSDLKSFFVSGGYHSENTVIKTNVFSGLEKTYQSWQGVPSVRLKNDLEGMKRYEEHWLYSEEETSHMINSDSRTYNYYTYDNQIDLYGQDHYQLHFSHKFSQMMNLNASAHYTRGKGYYENYKPDEDLADYLLEEIGAGEKIIESTDLVNRKWLDNHFYGVTFSLNYENVKRDMVLGGGWNTYDGNHYGNVIWAQFLGNAGHNHEWYRNNGLKRDLNMYLKYNYKLSDHLNLFADLQYRHINYTIDGTDDDLRDISQKHKFDFFNPKTGIFYQPAANQKVYLSFSVANREPNRVAYTDIDPDDKQPVHETLYDLELGYNFRSTIFTGSLNLYYMMYDDQLVLTGQINNVGNPIMVNVDDSYRAGAELQTGIKVLPNLEWYGNATFSRNKIKNFTEYVDNWDTGSQASFDLGTTDIAFSPNITANSQLLCEPAKRVEIQFVSSYVGKQYIDNTSGEDRTIDPYFVNNIQIGYSLKTGFFENIKFRLMVNNLFNEKYESNAWVYSYLLNGERYKMDGYFPQAGRHFMIGADIKF